MSPSTKRAEARQKRKRKRKRHKCKKVRKDLLVQSKQTVISQAARGRVFEKSQIMKRRESKAAINGGQEGARDLQMLINHPQMSGDWIQMHNKSTLALTNE